MKEKLATTLAVLPAALLATMAISSVTVWAASLFGVEIPEQAGLEDILRMRGAQLANAAFMLSVVLPVAEELVFRGALFQFPLWIAAKARRGAGAARWQTAGAAVLSSALFSAAHYFERPFPDNAFVSLFAFGLVLCWLLRRTGAIWWTMLLHGLFNASTLALIFAFPELAKA